MEKPGTLEDPLALELIGDGEQDLQVIGIFKIGMQGVGSFDDGQFFGRNGNGIPQRLTAAQEGAVSEGDACFQRHLHH